MSSPTNQPAADAANNNSANASGKAKGKQKKKGEKLDIELNFANPTTTQNWATIMENDTESDVLLPQFQLPDAPKALTNVIDLSTIPTSPPYRATLRNVNYDVVEDDLNSFFGNLRINDIQINKEGGRIIRSVTIDFETRQDLIQAFDNNGKLLKTRPVYMNIGSDRYNDRGGYGDRGDRRGRGGFGRDNTPSDWRFSRDSGSQRQMFPPPQIDSYDQSRGGGYNRSGQRGGRYNDDYPSRSEYSGRDVGYDHRGPPPPPNDDRGGYDDRGGFGGRGPRNDYGGGRSDRGNWGRGDRMQHAGVGGADPESDNWRRGPPPPPPVEYDPPRGGRTGYDDQTGPPPARAMQQPYRNDSAGSHYGSGVHDGEYRQPPPLVNDRMRHGGGNDYDRRGDYDRAPPRNDYRDGGGHRNPPLMDHPPARERLSSTRSNVSATTAPTETDDYPSTVGDSALGKERKKLIGPSMFAALMEKVSDSNNKLTIASYSSIFGDAKPVDTSKKELEIVKKLQSSKPVPVETTDVTGVGSADGQSGLNPVATQATVPSRDYHPSTATSTSHQETSIPPRHAARRANGGIGDRRDGRREGSRRDYDNNGALSDQRRGARSGPRTGGSGMRRDGPREYYSGGGVAGRTYRGGDGRIGGRRGYGDSGNDSHRYDRPRYDNERTRYNSGSGSDYQEWKEDHKDDSKVINYASTNKFDHLGDGTEDHSLE